MRPVPGLAALAAAAALAAIAAAPAARAAGNPAAQPPGRCDARLIVKMSPEVPNPRDPEFLSSLVGEPGFRLIWRGHSDMSQTLELIGPGPAYRCRREIARMRNDARVLDIQVVR